ncbi:BgtAc-30087 [Blumeria graminis f. sp. tritici]|uniref:BgtAc-30087 n=2 Tax=Blumeria graminis f. sp. tritici TaxID=62690 RepID=A0A9X9MJJ4_BLUGR|nr:BgtAc-30087 [Blumeria graminis f. sp. tritici]
MRLLNSIFLVAYVLQLAYAMAGGGGVRMFKCDGEVSFKETKIMEALKRILASHGKLIRLSKNDPSSKRFVYQDLVLVNLYRGRMSSRSPLTELSFKTMVKPVELLRNLRSTYWVIASCENDECKLSGIARKSNTSLKYTECEEVQKESAPQS